ncbi:MAG: CBS domain-containing protein [Gemmataceae bacterium]|nr:CBS domain-containing protein [Gemmataceae bacterium]MCI0737584.1 CBS domain-containing protein [Gemmataceae bacterium]
MQVKEIMTHGVEYARLGDNIADVAERMRELDIGSLPVCGDNQLPVGMITDRDITVRATAAGCDPKSTPVNYVMTPTIICCYDDEEVEDAAQLMKQSQIRRVPVLDHQNHLVGILALGDLAEVKEARPLAEEALEAISAPSEA